MLRGLEVHDSREIRLPSLVGSFPREARREIAESRLARKEVIGVEIKAGAFVVEEMLLRNIQIGPGQRSSLRSSAKTPIENSRGKATAL